MNQKRALTLCLTVCLIFASLPTFTAPAKAAGSSTDISDMNALDAIGIDTSKVPDGVDLDSTDNPYGRNTATVNPVYELFVQESAGSTLYGHNKAVGKTWAEFYDSQNAAKTGATTGSYAATATASGNFTGGATGGQGQTVTVAAGALSPHGGLYLYFSDPVADTKGDAKTLIDPISTIGNSGNQMDEDFATDSYLMQNYLKIAAGDYDGDSVDEVAVYVAAQGSSRVEIYDLQLDDTFDDDPDSEDYNAPTYYLSSAKWAKAWTYYFNESPYVSNMVSVTSGDFNHDGVDDLGLTWGYYYGSDNYTNSKAKILCGSKTAMLQKNMTIDLNYDNSQIVRAAFSYGDIDGDNVDDLILGGELNSDIAAGNLYSRFAAVYTYNGDSDSFIQSVAQNFDLFSKQDNGEYVYAAMATHGGRFFSLPTTVANVAPVNLQGVGRAANIYIDSLIIEYGDDGLDIVAALDQSTAFNKYATLDYGVVKATDGRFYSEYGVVSADFTGRGTQSLEVMIHFSAEHYTSTFTVPYYRNWWHELWGIEDYTEITVDLHIAAETVAAAVQGVLTEQKDASGNVTGYSFDVTVKERVVPFATSFCRLNSDTDTAFINYTGEHGVIYSDPKVLAVLASPPHFADLSSDDLSGSYMESSTSYSSTEGSGSESTTSDTLSIGAYVSYEHDFEVFGVKVAGMETELAYTHGWTWETTKASTVEMTVSYETVVGQDSVAFYSIPMEYYVYDSYVPIIDESTGQITGYDKQKMSVNLPHTAAVVVLSLDKYEKIAADYPELPKIAGTVLTHTVGDPSTYPSSTAGYSNALEYNGDWSGVDFSSIGASVTQEIAITDENGSGLTNTNTVDFQIGAGPGDAIFGVSAGYERGSSKVTITSNGSTYAGTVYNMPAEAEQYGYYYAWKLFTYTYTIGGSTFPVVNYEVKDVTEPPALPADFAQDNTLTTDSAIGLTWSYPSNSAIAGFQIYRYYEFPDGSGSYELAFVPASTVDYTTKDANGALIRHYRYVDNGLADYTDYDYQIQTVRAAVPPSSILSDVLTGRTEADKGYPTLTLNGVTAKTILTYDDAGTPTGSVTDYSLLVYPDTNSAVSVSVAESYSQTPRYQWQKLTDEGWQDVAGATQASHTFSSSGASDEGQYRCRVNAIYEDEGAGEIYYISAYSEPFTLDYSTRTPKMVDGSFAVDLPNQSVSIALKSAHTNHTFAPSGDVTFTVSGADYAASYTVALSTPDSNYVTTATLDLGVADHDNDGINANLPAGVYQISAYYAGSRVFGSLTIDNSVYYVSGNSSGYLLNVDSAFTYGDTITPKLMSISASSGTVQATEVSVGVTYKVYQEKPVTRTVTYTVHWFWLWSVTYTRTYVTYEYVECDGFVDTKETVTPTDDTVTARTVGSYTLEAWVGGAKVASQDFVVKQRDITVGFEHAFTGVAGDTGNVAHPTAAALRVLSGSLAYSNELTNLGLVVNAYNTAGDPVVITAESTSTTTATPPGLYTIVGAAATTPGADDTDHDDYTNYSITYVSSTYILTGPKYNMTLVSARYGSDEAIVGTVEIIKPEVTQDDGTTLSMATTATDDRWDGTAVFIGGTAVTLRATPQVGYEVKSWTVTTATKSTTTVTSSTTHAFETTANNTTVTVTYQLADDKLYFQSANSGRHDGTVIGVGNSIQSGALVQPDATYTFRATPATGFHFVEWTLAGSTNSNFTGTYDPATGTSTTTITMGSVDTVLSAVFERDSYTLELSANLKATYLTDDGFGGLVPVTGSGTVIIPGDTQVVVAPKTGYSLPDGTTWYVNRVGVGSTAKSYTFTIEANTKVEAGTSQNEYDIAVSVSQPSDANNVVTVKTDKGDIPGTGKVLGGTPLTFRAIPAWGYVFDHWEVTVSDGTASTTSTETGTTFSVPALGANTTVEAVFEDNPDRYTISLTGNPGGQLTYSVHYNGPGDSENAPTNVMAVASGTGITAYKGDTVTLKATPASNYMLRSWTVGDTVDESPDTTLTLTAISANKTVVARFIPMSFAAVTYSVGGGSGSITSATSDGAPFASGDPVGNGTKVVVEAAPAAGQMISHWTVAGNEVKTTANTTFVGQTLTIDSLAAGATAEIKVYFTALAEHEVSFSLTDAAVNRAYSPAAYVGQTPSTEPLDSTQFVDHVLSGSSAVFTAEPADGYRITEFTVGPVNVIEGQGGIWTYTANNVTTDLAIVVKAAKLYTITVDGGIANGSIAVTTAKDATKAIAGETITLSSVTPALDYTFGGWSYDGETVDGATFAMPEAGTTVSATFTQIDPVTISYSVYDTNGVADGGTNGAITAEADRDGDVVSDSDGSLTVGRGYSDSYVDWPATVVTFTATPSSGYMVKYWYIDGAKVTADTENCVIGGNTMALTAVQASAAAYNVQVQFELIGDKITYSAADAHGTITGAVLTDAYQQTTPISSGSTLIIGGTIMFTAKPDNGYQVEGWYVNGVKQTGETATAYAYTATPGVGVEVTVRFERVSYMVTYGGTNGAVTATVGGNAIGGSPAKVVGDFSVTFTATANAGYAFDGWMVDGVISSDSTNPLTLTITSVTTVTASFTEDANCTITYGVNGSGGTLTAKNGGSAFTSGSVAAANDVITFTATPETTAKGGANNYRVASWTFDGVTTTSHDVTRTLTVTQATNVSVTFERYDYVVTYEVSGGNGTISAATGSTHINNLARVAIGSTVTFTATPASGYLVKAWTVDADGTPTATDTESTTHTISNLTADTEVTVEFKQVPAYTITIATSGTGHGSVTAKSGDDPAVTGATSVTVPRHGTVTLTAVRYDPNNAFNGWTVSANPACDVQKDGIVLTLSDVTGDIAVEAAFTPATMVSLSASSGANGGIDYDGVQVGYLSAGLTDTVVLPSSGSVQITSGMDVVIKALPAPGYMVKEWRVKEGLANWVVQDELSKTLTVRDVSADTTIQAAFEPLVTYAIPADGDQSNGGYYTVQPGSKTPNDVGDATHIRERGTVTFTVAANDGVYFTDLTFFGVDCLTSAGSAPGTQQNIVSAVKNAGESYTITVANVKVAIDSTIRAVKPVVTIIPPTNGAITVTYEDGAAVTSGDEVPVGTVLTITATPDAGYFLKAWGGAVTGKSGTEINLAVAETENVAIFAEFALPTVTVPVPANGTIVVTYVNDLAETIQLADTSTAAAGTQNLTFTIAAGTQLMVSGTPATGYTLSGWGGAAAGKSGADITLTVPGKDIVISATFAVPGGGGGFPGGGMIPPPGGGSGQIITDTSENDDGTLTTTVTVTTGATVADNAAAATVDETAAEALIEQVKAAEAEASTSGASNISVVLDATVGDQVTNTAMELPVSALNSIVDETSASLTLLTNTAQVVFDQTALSAVAGAASGDTVTLSVAEVDKATLPQAVQSAIGDAFVLDLTVSSANGRISSFGGGTATVSVPVPADMIGKGMKVVLIADDGTLTEVAGTVVTIDGVEYYRFTTGHFSQYALMEDTSLPFTDVQTGAWYYDAVSYAYRNNLISGTSPDTFEPNGTTTRAMLVTILWRLAGQPAAGGSGFTDVAGGTWYSTAVAWAKGAGVVGGIGDGLFAPNDSITREQMAVILYNYARHAGRDVSARGEISQFVDSAETSVWAEDAMKWAVGAGLISGQGNGILNPAGTATRAEIATILMRFIQ